MIVALCQKAAQSIVDDDYDRAIEYKAKIEKEEKEFTDEGHPLFSREKGRRVSIRDKMVEMDGEYDELMFVLSDSSNESIRTVKSFTVEEVVKFTRQLNLKYERQKNARHTADTD